MNLTLNLIIAGENRAVVLDLQSRTEMNKILNLAYLRGGKWHFIVNLPGIISYKQKSHLITEAAFSKSLRNIYFNPGKAAAGVSCSLPKEGALRGVG